MTKTAKEQVQAVYPDAVCEYIARWDCYAIRNIPNVVDGQSEPAAWESALQTIKNETK